mgnify:CR=1 FL=1
MSFQKIEILGPAKFDSKDKIFCYFERPIPNQVEFSVTRVDYNGALKSHDLLKIQDISLVEILFVKKNPLQELLSSLNAVISTNERH